MKVWEGNQSLDSYLPEDYYDLNCTPNEAKYQFFSFGYIHNIKTIGFSRKHKKNRRLDNLNFFTKYILAQLQRLLNLLFPKFFAQNCMKMKEFRQRGDARP